MTFAKVVAKVRRHANFGWGPRIISSSDDQWLHALVHQKGAYIAALEYIADDSDVSDEIKSLARIALGREWNRDRTAAKKEDI
jgi:hypothetical protein